MATINKTNVVNGNIVEAQDILNIIEALDGTASTNIIISSSLNQGSNNTVNWNYSHAEGSNNLVDGVYSHAEGNYNITSGSYSHTEGNLNIAYGAYSHAEGGSNIAYGDNSHTEGNSNKSVGDYSHAEGSNNTTGLNGYAIVNITSGVISLDPSYGDVSGIFATELIIDDSITGNYGISAFSISSSVFSGSSTVITLDNLTVTTIFASVYPDYLITGYNTDTTLLGRYSHAEGSTNVVVSNGAYVNGSNNITTQEYQHVGGVWNKTTTSLFAIGNGIDERNRKNAFEVTTNSSIIVPQTQSATPGWTGIDGEIVPVSNGGKYYLFMWMNGNWRQAQFS